MIERLSAAVQDDFESAKTLPAAADERASGLAASTAEPCGVCRAAERSDENLCDRCRGALDVFLARDTTDTSN